MYFEMIERSKTWTCPKDGTYLITCVSDGVFGNITSFGEFVSVSGTIGSITLGANSFPTQTQILPTGGYTPTDGVYGGYCIVPVQNVTAGECSKNAYLSENFPTGLGFGAGGRYSRSLKASPYTNTFFHTGMGKMTAKTVELIQGQEVICTVAKAYREPDANYEYSLYLIGKGGVIVIKGV